MTTDPMTLRDWLSTKFEIREPDRYVCTVPGRTITVEARSEDEARRKTLQQCARTTWFDVRVRRETS